MPLDTCSLELFATTSLILHSIIISFRPAWLARALLSFKRAQSSGNDDADEGQQTPLDVARGDVRKSRAMWLTKTVDITVS